MENWDEIRTAYQVVRSGTVSGAAEALGVHHATVIRHIDALETRLGTKLFQRHARGYTPTEEGRDLARIAETTDTQFNQLQARLRGGGAQVSGELRVTSLVSTAPLMVDVLTGFQEKYPDVTVMYHSEDRVLRLEYGEAHVAVRAGDIPQEPDNVVQPFLQAKVGLYASQAYIDKYGKPGNIEDARKHRFVGPTEDMNRAPFFRWINQEVPKENIVFRSRDTRVQQQAIIAGIGIGFVEDGQARNEESLVLVVPPLEEWVTQLWLVTHVDLHRTAKVQAFLSYLKAHATKAVSP